MFSWLKHHLIPHTKNNHRPHFLRRESMRGLAGFVLLLEVFVGLSFLFNTPGGFSWTAAVLPAVLGDLTNEQRANNHLAILTENPTLDQIATLKAEDMARKGYFSHTSPEGLTPWYWFDKVGYDYEYAGENLAIDFTDSHDVTDAWMNSPTHRANIVKSAFTEIGTGVATGTFEGTPTVFVAQVYAKPAEVLKPTITNNLNLEKSIKTAEVGTIQKSTGTKDIVIEPRVLGVATNTLGVIEPAFWQKIILSPRHTTNTLFGVIIVGILIALCIHVFVKKDAKHVDLVLNGLVVIILVVALCIMNWVFSKHTQTSFQSFDTSGAILNTE